MSPCTEVQWHWDCGARESLSMQPLRRSANLISCGAAYIPVEERRWPGDAFIRRKHGET